jgi:hypothetical protein
MKAALSLALITAGLA